MLTLGGRKSEVVGLIFIRVLHRILIFTIKIFHASQLAPSDFTIILSPTMQLTTAIYRKINEVRYACTAS